MMPDEREVPLQGGWVNEVVRVGDTVHRSAGPWTPAVHALLRHLEARGFEAAPRVLGFDEQGREVLTYIEGMPAVHPWPTALRTEQGLAEMVRLLRRYHDAVVDFRPPAGAIWRTGKRDPGRGEIVLHRDAGPWNVLWRDDKPVALIDWDFAEPGPAINDLAFMAWYAIPLHEHEEATGLDRSARLRAMCVAYGSVTPEALLQAVEAVQAEDLRRLLELGRRGVEPWSLFVARGEEDFVRASMAWLRQHRPELL